MSFGLFLNTFYYLPEVYWHVCHSIQPHYFLLGVYPYIRRSIHSAFSLFARLNSVTYSTFFIRTKTFLTIEPRKVLYRADI